MGTPSEPPPGRPDSHPRVEHVDKDERIGRLNTKTTRMVLEKHDDRKTGVTLAIIERRFTSFPPLPRQYVTVERDGRYVEVECRDRQAARARFAQMVADLEDLGRQHPTTDEFAAKSLEDLALERVERDPDLAVYGDQILYGGDVEDSAHWAWVIGTPKRELLAWVAESSAVSGVTR